MSEETREQLQGRLEGGADDVKLDNLLNSKGFPEFLAKFPDADSLEMSDENLGEIKERYEGFFHLKVAENGLKRFFKDKVSADLGFKLTDSELVFVGDFLMERAIESPSEIKEISSTLDLFESLPGQIAEKERQLEALAEVNIAELRSKTIDLALYQDFGALKRNLPTLMQDKGEKAVSQRVRSEYKLKNNDIPAELAKLEAVISAKTEAETALQDVKQSLSDMRDKLLGEDFLPLKKLSEVVMSRVQKQANEAFEKARTDTKHLKKVEELSALLNQLDESEDGMNYLSAYDAEKARLMFTDGIDSAVEESITGGIERSLASASTDTLSGFERKLLGSLEIKAIGTKSEEDVRALVVGTLQDKHDSLTAPKDKPKKLLLRRVISKLKNKTNHVI